MPRNEPQVIINTTRATVVCHEAVIADRPLTRMRGLLGRSGLDAGEGILLTPAPSIHTAFMRFAIDAVLLDSELRVVKIAADLGPWRTAGARRARAVLELAAGEADRVGLELEDRLEVRAPDAFVNPLAAAEADPSAPARVLVVAADRRFRMFASTSLSRRGYHVTVRSGTVDVAELVASECVDVALIDATASLTVAAHEAARMRIARPRLGIVAVSEDPPLGLSAFPVLPRWGSFDSLCGAIEQARAARALEDPRHAGR
ncbi:MAG TPA: DUF192 domain-containing protein [Solirubrobacteraceae bacterium]|jgi:hypothetical protein|nr:DUF192 domain-containing protein [Solirubrobacteraceae bacterium]